MRIRRAYAITAIAAAGITVTTACSSGPQSPIAQNGAAHPAVPCSRIAAQVHWLEHYSQQVDSVAMSTVNPYPRMQKLANALSDVSNGSGTELAVAEVNYESDEQWESAGSPLSASLGDDIGRLAALCH